MLARDLKQEVKTAIPRDAAGGGGGENLETHKGENLAPNKALSEVGLSRTVRKMTPEEYTAYDKELRISKKSVHRAAAKRMHS